MDPYSPYGGAGNNMQYLQQNMPAPVPVNPSEPLLLVPDMVALGAGLFFSSARTALWGAALVDIIGRQVSQTYRAYSYQYVHRYFFR